MSLSNSTPNPLKLQLVRAIEALPWGTPQAPHFVISGATRAEVAAAKTEAEVRAVKGKLGPWQRPASLDSVIQAIKDDKLIGIIPSTLPGGLIGLDHDHGQELDLKQAVGDSFFLASRRGGEHGHHYFRLEQHGYYPKSEGPIECAPGLKTQGHWTAESATGETRHSVGFLWLWDVEGATGMFRLAMSAPSEFPPIALQTISDLRMNHENAKGQKKKKKKPEGEREEEAGRAAEPQGEKEPTPEHARWSPAELANWQPGAGSRHKILRKAVIAEVRAGRFRTASEPRAKAWINAAVAAGKPRHEATRQVKDHTAFARKERTGQAAEVVAREAGKALEETLWVAGRAEQSQDDATGYWLWVDRNHWDPAKEEAEVIAKIVNNRDRITDRIREAVEPAARKMDAILKHAGAKEAHVSRTTLTWPALKKEPKVSGALAKNAAYARTKNILRIAARAADLLSDKKIAGTLKHPVFKTVLAQSCERPGAPSLPYGLFPALNGIVNVETGAVQKHHPRTSTATTISPASYIPGEWDKHAEALQRAFPNMGQKEFALVTEVVGWNMLRRGRGERNILFINGPMGSGKSTLAQFINVSLGGEDLNEKTFAKGGSEINANLATVVAAKPFSILLPEIKDLYAIQLLLAMSGSDVITSRFPYGPQLKARLQSLFIFPATDPPRVAADSGLLRRTVGLRLPAHVHPVSGTEPEFIPEARNALVSLALRAAQLIAAWNPKEHEGELYRPPGGYAEDVVQVADPMLAFCLGLSSKRVGTTVKSLVAEYAEDQTTTEKSAGKLRNKVTPATFSKKLRNAGWLVDRVWKEDAAGRKKRLATLVGFRGLPKGRREALPEIQAWFAGGDGDGVPDSDDEQKKSGTNGSESPSVNGRVRRVFPSLDARKSNPSTEEGGRNGRGGVGKSRSQGEKNPSYPSAEVLSTAKSEAQGESASFCAERNETGSCVHTAFGDVDPSTGSCGTECYEGRPPISERAMEREGWDEIPEDDPDREMWDRIAEHE